MKYIFKCFFIFLPFISLTFADDCQDRSLKDPDSRPGSDPSSYTPIELLDPEKIDPISD